MTRSDTMKPRRIGALTGATRLLFAAALVGLLPIATDASQQRPANHLVARKVIAAPPGASKLCAQHQWACTRTGGANLPTRTLLKLAKSVNTSVNRKVRPISDLQQYGVDELWALPTGRGGDCEDFALLKKKMLIKAGIRAEDLLIATVLDRKRGSHAVLVLRTSGGDFVLDNLRNQISPWRDTGYSFIRMQSPDRPDAWVAVLAGGVFEA